MNCARARPSLWITESSESTQSEVSVGSRSGSCCLKSPKWSYISEQSLGVHSRMPADRRRLSCVAVNGQEPAAESTPERSIGLGVDFGGTGIKSALIDMATGELMTSRVRVPTPKPSTPEAVAATIQAVVARAAKDHAIPDGIPVGLGLPGVIKNGVCLTAANIDKGWVGTSADDVVG